jgi:hypothetical protein
MTLRTDQSSRRLFIRSIILQADSINLTKIAVSPAFSGNLFAKIWLC